MDIILIGSFLIDIVALSEHFFFNLMCSIASFPTAVGEFTYRENHSNLNNIKIKAEKNIVT